MSDSLRTYCAVKGRICQVLPDEHRYRVTNLSLMVTGVVCSRSVQQSQVASEMPLTCRDRSLVQRQRRFLMNAAVEVDRFYGPFIRPFVQARHQHMLPLILDSSPAGRHCQMLMAAVGYQHRALPLVWSVRKGQKGHSCGSCFWDVWPSSRAAATSSTAKTDAMAAFSPTACVGSVDCSRPMPTSLSASVPIPSSAC